MENPMLKSKETTIICVMILKINIDKKTCSHFLSLNIKSQHFHLKLQDKYSNSNKMSGKKKKLCKNIPKVRISCWLLKKNEYSLRKLKRNKVQCNLHVTFNYMFSLGLESINWCPLINRVRFLYHTVLCTEHTPK